MAFLHFLDLFYLHSFSCVPPPLPVFNSGQDVGDGRQTCWRAGHAKICYNKTKTKHCSDVDMAWWTAWTVEWWTRTDVVLSPFQFA